MTHPPRPSKIVAVHADIVADVSRLTTLEPGDVILTGTPTGSTVVIPGDVVEVEVTAGDLSTGRLRSPIEAASYPLTTPGAMPRADDSQRAAAYGETQNPDDAERISADSPSALLTAIFAVSVATLASQLKKRGYDSLTLDRLRVTNPALHEMSIPEGLYPLGPKWKPAYEAWLKEKENIGS